MIPKYRLMWLFDLSDYVTPFRTMNALIGARLFYYYCQ